MPAPYGNQETMTEVVQYFLEDDRDMPAPYLTYGKFYDIERLEGNTFWIKNDIGFLIHYNFTEDQFRWPE